MPPSSVELNPDPQAPSLLDPNLERADQIVLEIFQVMFGLEIQPFDLSHSGISLPESEQKIALVGFSGVIRGSCQLRISSLAAKCIASAMLGGVPLDEEDESIDDALGELCNMLAGGWKNSTPGLASQCFISPPTVISGQSYKVHQRKYPVNYARSYSFGLHQLHLNLHFEDAVPSA